MTRCSLPGCQSIVNLKGKHTEVDGKLFCSWADAQEWLYTSRKLAEAVRPHYTNNIYRPPEQEICQPDD
jgi:hypothetical protein